VGACADNVPAYRLELVPEAVGDVDAAIERLREFLPLDEDELARFQSQRKTQRRFQSLPLKFRLTEGEVAAFAVRRQWPRLRCAVICFPVWMSCPT